MILQFRPLYPTFKKTILVLPGKKNFLYQHSFKQLGVFQQVFTFNKQLILTSQ